MGRQITEAEFGELLSGFARSAFRLETRASYAIGIERDAYHRFLAGHPPPPSEVGWFQDWLSQIRQLCVSGRTIGRVRVLTEPPTDYQRFEMWCGRWNREAGEQIRYMPRSRAAGIGLPLDDDFWLFDETRLIIMRFTDAGEIAGKELITDTGIIARYIAWRDLAVNHATATEAASVA
jgi:hypothetical protein